jgi:glutathione S-transferase
MRTLYHFQFSPFSRRTRLALAHKQLDVQLREGREDPAAIEEARRLAPFRTIPVLVDEGRAMGDSTAIAHWLDVAYPDAPRLWPADDAADVLQVTALVDVVLDNVIDVGTRYHELHGDPAWETVKAEQVGRARTAAEALGGRVATLGRSTVSRGGWSAADIWLLTLAMWFETMPARAPTNRNIAQILALGLELPRALLAWTDAHRDRADVRALATQVG